MKISALVLAHNEEEMITDCLKQLDFVDEVIVLDQNSQDKTVEIAKKFTDKIYKSDKKAFDENRNVLFSLAKGKWLLYLDADERLSHDLINEIRLAVKDQRYSAYYFPRKNIILGKWLKHGGWWPDYVPRLFKKDKLIKWSGAVHESPEIKGKFGYLKNPIKHLTARSISSMLSKSTKWAKIEAELYAKSNYQKVSILKVIKAILFELVERYIFKRGFLDGYVGLIEAIYQSLHQAMILVYLWEIQKGKTINIK